MQRRDRLVLGVDLDGVCADYEGGLRDVVASIRGVDPGSLAPQTSLDGYSQWGLSEEEFEEIHCTAVRDHRLFRKLEPIAGVSKALWHLSDRGVWIRIITHRLLFNGVHEASAADTAWWLDEHDLPYRDLCFIGAKPDVGADVYVDDSPHNILALRAAHKQAIVFDQAYNRALPAPRASTWQDVVTLVDEILAGWDLQARLPLDELADGDREGPR